MHPFRHFTTLLACLLCAPVPAMAVQVNEQLALHGELLADALAAEVEADTGFHARRVQAGATFQAGRDDRLGVTAEQAGDGGAVTVRGFHWQHNLAPTHVLRAGIQPQPLVDKDERDLWGERLAAPAFAEYWGLAPAADAGVGVFGQAGGAVDYHLLVSNGEGYGNPADGKGVALSARVGLFDGPWELGGAVYDEGDHGGVAGDNPRREIVYFFHHGAGATLGGQYLRADGGTGFTDAEGYNVQGRLSLGGEGELFGRYDRVETGATGVRQSLTVIGFTGHPAPGVTLAPTVTLRDHGPYDDTTYGIHARFAF
ncbi:MAG: hypothetical protein HZA24_11645 [Nitrospirae bacterium]|nr:hypothetical protein [Nitrospirota bacterium]